MCARQLATLCLSFAFLPTVWAQSPESKLVVFLGTAAGQPSGPVEQMKRELAPLMRSAGYEVGWRNLRGSNRDLEPGEALVVLSLNGTCGVEMGQPPTASPLPAGTSLAITSVTDGRVLPFSTVNCSALTHVLGNTLSGEPGARRDYLYGRAMARVVAHELYHVLAGTREHTMTGVARSCFSTADLLSERFQFEGTALARLKPETRTSADALADDATDR